MCEILGIEANSQKTTYTNSSSSLLQSINPLFLTISVLSKKKLINYFGYRIEQFGDWKIEYILVILCDILVKIPLNLVMRSIK